MLLYRYTSFLTPPTTDMQALAELQRYFEHQVDNNNTILENMINQQNAFRSERNCASDGVTNKMLKTK